MKRLPLLFILLVGLEIVSKAQIDKPNHIGINIWPLRGNSLELGYSIDIKPYLSADCFTGYVFNSPMGSPHLVGSLYEAENKSGFFIKIGARFNFRKDLNKLAFFTGLNLVNSIAIEEGYRDQDFNQGTSRSHVKRNSYNLGINGIIGITSPTIKRVNIVLGLQVGKVLIDNLVDFHSYMPGMGVYFPYDLRSQGILTIKYRIK